MLALADAFRSLSLNLTQVDASLLCLLDARWRGEEGGHRESQLLMPLSRICGLGGSVQEWVCAVEMPACVGAVVQ